MTQYAQVQIGRPPKFCRHDMDLMRQLRDGGMTLQMIADKFETNAAHARLVCKGIPSPSNRKREQVRSWMKGNGSMTITEAINSGLGDLGIGSKALRHHFEALVKQGQMTREQLTCCQVESGRLATVIKYKLV